MERGGVLTVNPLNGAESIALNQRVVIRLANPVAPGRVGPQSVRWFRSREQLQRH